MRLLNVHTFRLHTFYGSQIPPYAILSHTWLEDQEEVTFARFQAHPLWDWRELRGARKIDFLCQQAADDGYDWAWADTCCIDKSNNAELSEAINSMFRWYQRSEICYVYLMDIDMDGACDVFASRWWSRAWTLQELVAPTDVRFYDVRWRLTGSKAELADEISREKHIDVHTLRDSGTMYSKSIASRMSWAAHRQATREEDLAYALLGIFNINMTMLYGEGEKAFVRLQQEITRTTNDMSLFAWGFSPLLLDDVHNNGPGLRLQTQSGSSEAICNDEPGKIALNGLYAAHPSDFAGAQDIIHLAQHVKNAEIEERNGTQMLKTVVICSPDWGHDDQDDVSRHQWSIALLPCILPHNQHSLVGILLRRWNHEPSRTMRHAFARDVYSCLVRSDAIGKAELRRLKVDTGETNQLLGLSIHHSRMVRTMVVVYDSVKDCTLEVLKPTIWEQDECNPRRFITQDDSPVCFTALRFIKKDVPHAVYIAFMIQPIVQNASAARSTRVIHSAVKITSAETPSDQVFSILREHVVGPKRLGLHVKYDIQHCLYVVVTTNTVFNQALITVTLGKRAGQSRSQIKDQLLREASLGGPKTEARIGKPYREPYIDWVEAFTKF